MCGGLAIINLMMKKMKFRELFWAHLTHKEMWWAHVLVVCCIPFFLWLNQIFNDEFSPVEFLGVWLFLVFGTYESALFFAMVRVPAEVKKREEVFYWDSNWQIYILRLTMRLVAFTVFLRLMNSSYWPFTFYTLAVIFCVTSIRRYFKLRKGQQSHFRAHKHRSSKTIR